MKKKQKKIIILVSIIFIVLLGILFIYKLQEKDNLIELTYQEVIGKLDNNETFVLCISSTNCSHCKTYKPKLRRIASKYNIIINYIDIDKYTKEEQRNFSSLLSFDGATPLTLFLKEGKEITVSNRLSGDVPSDKVIDKLKKNSFIK